MTIGHICMSMYEDERSFTRRIFIRSKTERTKAMIINNFKSKDNGKTYQTLFCITNYASGHHAP